MEIHSNYSITQLFAAKELIVTIDNKSHFTLKVPVLRDLYNDSKWNNVFFLWTRPIAEGSKYYYKKVETALDMITLIVFDAAQYSEFVELNSLYKFYLEKWLPDIEYDYKNQIFKIKDITITVEIW